jgi:hypothetical protein
MCLIEVTLLVGREPFAPHAFGSRAFLFDNPPDGHFRAGSPGKRTHEIRARPQLSIATLAPPLAPRLQTTLKLNNHHTPIPRTPHFRLKRSGKLDRRLFPLVTAIV